MRSILSFCLEDRFFFIFKEREIVIILRFVQLLLLGDQKTITRTQTYTHTKKKNCFPLGKQ